MTEENKKIKTDKEKKHSKCRFFAQCMIIFLIAMFILFVNNVSYAGEVPKFNPNDKNPKFGLYRLDAPSVELGSKAYIRTAVLNSSNIIFYSTKANKYNHQLYIFNTQTYKIFTPSKVSNYLKRNKLRIQHIFVPDKNLEDNKILLSLAGKKREIMEYDFSTNSYKIFQLPLSAGSCDIYKTDSDNLCLLCKAGGAGLEKPLHYIKIFNLNEQKITAEYPDNSREQKYYNKLLQEHYSRQAEKSGYPQAYPYLHNIFIPIIDINDLNYLNNDTFLSRNLYNKSHKYPSKVTIVSRGEADYGMTICKYLKMDEEKYGNYCGYYSWFSPIYEYDLKTKKLTAKHQYMRSIGYKFVPIKNKNMVLIIGGTGFYKDEYINADPKDVPYVKRINHHKPNTKYVYIYVYDEE